MYVIQVEQDWKVAFAALPSDMHLDPIMKFLQGFETKHHLIDDFEKAGRISKSRPDIYFEFLLAVLIVRGREYHQCVPTTPGQFSSTKNKFRFYGTQVSSSPPPEGEGICPPPGFSNSKLEKL